MSILTIKAGYRFDFKATTDELTPMAKLNQVIASPRRRS